MKSNYRNRVKITHQKTRSGRLYVACTLKRAERLRSRTQTHIHHGRTLTHSYRIHVRFVFSKYNPLDGSSCVRILMNSCSTVFIRETHILLIRRKKRKYASFSSCPKTVYTVYRSVADVTMITARRITWWSFICVLSVKNVRPICFTQNYLNTGAEEIIIIIIKGTFETVIYLENKILKYILFHKAKRLILNYCSF